MSELQDQLAALRQRMARVAAQCDEKYGKPENPYSTGFSRTPPQAFQVQEWFPGEEIVTDPTPLSVVLRAARAAGWEAKDLQLPECRKVRTHVSYLGILRRLRRSG